MRKRRELKGYKKIKGENDLFNHKTTPIHYQLMTILKSEIDSGRLKVGDRIPTEKELMLRYGISRSTVRQAVLQLVNEGYLRRKKFKGTFVTTPPATFRFMEGLRGFSAEMRSRGIPYSSTILEKKVILPTEKMQKRLQIGAQDEVFYLKRVRFVNSQPFLIDYHYIPYKFVPGIENKISDNVSLYYLLEHEYHLFLHHGWREFEPIITCSKEETELLEVFPSTPLLYIESVLYDKDGIPIDYFEAKIHGKFVVDVLNTQNSQ
uniref:GntR family transcriptional regulator n=1 Tax=candidate division WOR-3 bacterium TaxID=2052148 RepID=A0A7V3KMN5_UNCW3